MTIDGTNLAGATKILFNGTIATVISDHAAKIKVDVPAEAQTGFIKVKTPGGKAKSPSEFTVVFDSSSTTTTPASKLIGLGYNISDSAVVTGNATRSSPTGTVTFYVCGPTTTAEPCTSQADQVGSSAGIAAGSNDSASASSASFTPSSAGYWCFAGYYSGDSNYLASSDTTTNECFDVYAPLDDVESVTNAGDTYCALLTSGGVDCWGWNGMSELGGGGDLGILSASPVPVEGVGGVGTLTGVTSLVGTGEGFCALLTSGGVDCWGYGALGSLGQGTFNDSDTPVEVEGVGGTGTLNGVSSLVGSAYNYCARLNSGDVVCWGGSGELGNGSSSNSDLPVVVEGVGGTGTLKGVTSLFGAVDFGFCALLTSGGVDCWGFGDAGELGDGTFSDSDTPVAVVDVAGTGTLTGVASLAAGYYGVCALLTSGGVDCWGSGYYGDLGNGTFYTNPPNGSATPVQVSDVGGTGTLAGVTSLASDMAGYCVVLTSGGVDCWGAGTGGELGNGSTLSNSATPVEVEGVGGTGTLNGVSSLVGGYCAVLTSGGVDCWGTGYGGKLGDGTFSDSDTPVTVEGVQGTGTLAGVTSLVFGNANYCGLLNSGGVDCWGNGMEGDLGNGIVYRTGNDGSATPVEVG